MITLLVNDPRLVGLIAPVPDTRILDPLCLARIDLAKRSRGPSGAIPILHLHTLTLIEHEHRL